MNSSDKYFIGVDVGTGSARAALVNDSGKVLKMSVKSIKTWNPQEDHFQQSSNDIWNACITSIKDVILNIDPDVIKGIGFTATCSLVAIDDKFEPISVSTTGDIEQNIILWMDHRAKNEADIINATNHPVLKYVGGKVSLEMQMPKLLWMKKNLPETWNKIRFLFDLPDFLTWKATDSESRSLCSVVCKWNFQATDDGTQTWNNDFLMRIGLEDLLEDNCMKIGQVVLPPGAQCGVLSDKAAASLGLLPGIPVGSSIIDAHSGGLGMIGCSAYGICNDFDTRLNLICGTSTCHMSVSKSSIFVPGVWGPYYSAMVPEYWLNEAGQSASGILIEHIINSHPASKAIKEKCSNKLFIQEYLNTVLKNLAAVHKCPDISFLTKDLHVWPDFHGNRSPIADSSIKGMISGLNLTTDEENLALIYLATLQALAYGTRHIMECLIKCGHRDFESILICGGLSKNELFTQIQADAVGLPLLRPKESESVLVGAAILGACGANYFSNIPSAIRNMGGEATIIHPNKSVYEYHQLKYQVFLKMLSDQVSYKTIMKKCLLSSES